MCNIGDILNTVTGGLLKDPAKEAAKEAKKAEERRLAMAEQVKKDEEEKRRVKKALRQTVDTNIVGSTQGTELSV